MVERSDDEGSEEDDEDTAIEVKAVAERSGPETKACLTKQQQPDGDDDDID